MKRALLIVLDSVGIGHAPDAADFGDEGADTVGHIRESQPGLAIPHLDAAGLAHAQCLAADRPPPPSETTLAYGCLTERSPGKDTTTGHWELAGAPCNRPFATFPSFPPELVAEMEAASGVSFLGNYAQSGTVILDELGAEHLATGRPILYTSADSVIQVAAHIDRVPLDQLYAICRAIRPLADREHIGRVIARPFAGEPGAFVRTADRHDFSLIPSRTVLNALKEAGIPVHGVGKIPDIYAGSGISTAHPTASNRDGMDTVDRLWRETRGSSCLVFVNLVDFDMLYGHRRDPAGYARALEEFDAWFGPFHAEMGQNELLLVTADHGNDPTWSGTDHTRERVPILMKSPAGPGSLGAASTFSAVAGTLASWFRVPERFGSLLRVS